MRDRIFKIQGAVQQKEIVRVAMEIKRYKIGD